MELLQTLMESPRLMLLPSFNLTGKKLVISWTKETQEVQTLDTPVTLDTLVTLETLEVTDHQCLEPNHAMDQQQLVTTPPQVTQPPQSVLPVLAESNCKLLLQVKLVFL